MATAYLMWGFAVEIEDLAGLPEVDRGDGVSSDPAEELHFLSDGNDVDGVRVVRCYEQGNCHRKLMGYSVGLLVAEVGGWPHQPELPASVGDEWRRRIRTFCTRVGVPYQKPGWLLWADSDS